MSFKVGLVGLPNVGKSTLFNALTKSSVPAQNYPFCTIDPHIAIAPMPDARLEHLKQLYNSAKIIPNSVTFVDIAGLVKGAATGEGLGNKFLNNIREVDVILHVIRCFDDADIIHTSSTIDPLEDFTIINTELMLKDLEAIENRTEKIAQLIKKAAQDPKQKKELETELALLQKITQAINKSDVAAIGKLIAESAVATIPLLAAKKFLIVANINEDDLTGKSYTNNQYFKKLVENFGPEKIIPISAKIEGELAQLSQGDAQEMMDLIGLQEPGLDKVIRSSYHALGLISFFTCGPKEIHAWAIEKNLPVRKAAGKIHSDLERGFICSDVFNYTDLAEYKTESKLKDLGKIRTEGQDYIMRDGDILHVKFNV
ncbi:MAG: redox-regulated ATPase YchF [Candidatus Babeliales bacterium]